MSTGVDTKHRLYSRNIFTWRMVRDALEGTNAVKRAAEVYLPMPVGFEEDDTAPSSSQRGSATMYPGTETVQEYFQENTPYWHSNPAYRAYLLRARFPDIVLNTLRGLIGVATRQDPTVELPAKISYLEDNATKRGQSIYELYVICLVEVLSQGRVTLVIDINSEDNTVCIVPYKTEKFINWQDDTKSGKLRLAVLEDAQAKAGSSEFELEQQPGHAVYTMNEGAVVLRKYVEGNLIADEEGNEEITPTLQGTSFEEIPMVTIGSVFNQTQPSPAPLSAIADVAYSIYRKDADLSNAQFMTCNPMFTITGAGADSNVPTMFGSTVALILENPAAKAFFPETDTSALDHVQGSIDKLFEEAANYGASLLGPTKKAAEAMETVKLRQGAQGATLVGVVNNVSKGLTDALKIAAQVSGADPEKVEFTGNTDFAETTLTPQMVTALMSLWQNGLYSKESFIKLLIESGLIHEDDEFEDELARIFNEPPAVTVTDDA